MKKLGGLMVAAIALIGVWSQASAQDAIAPPGSDAPLRSSDELNQLLGPIALYPDPLIAEILPAATFPTEIVMADRYVTEGGDPNQIASQPWDPSVQALAHYPTVLKWMDDNLTWTTELGQAFQNQQSDVMNAIQTLRSAAQGQGNLQSTPQENVESDDGDIEIEPTDPDELYVPYYQPDLIYSQPGNYWTFGIGFPIGLWLTHDWDWRGHHLLSWGPGNPRPGGWWRMPAAQRQGAIVANHAAVWHSGSRPNIIARGGDRGFNVPVATRAPAVPRAFARTAPSTRESEPARAAEPRSAPPVERAAPERAAPEAARPEPSFRAEPSEGLFGGGGSAAEVRESSSRGESSRGMSGGGESRGGSNRH